MTSSSSNKIDHVDIRLSPAKVVAQCRICHDDDETKNMETPCSCCGSLKYAHRKCVQRWCNEKGDTTCEICGQGYKSGYTAPTHLFRLGSIQMPLRGNWELPRRNHPNPYLVSMVATDRDLLEPMFDVYPSPRSILCYRIVAIIFITLLLLRHTLSIILDGTGEYTFTLYMLLVLRTFGILLPILVMLKLCSDVRQRRIHRQRISDRISGVASDEVDDSQVAQPQLRLIHVQ